MSHTDRIEQTFPKALRLRLPPTTALLRPWKTRRKSCTPVQFHPEVTHSRYGNAMLKNFLYNVCECAGDWQMDSFIEDTVAALREQIGTSRR